MLDGDSDQSTRDVFRSLVHPRLHKAENVEQMGPYATRTRAIELARTPYFFFLDGDDRLPCNAIEETSRALRSCQADFVVGDVRIFDDRHGTSKIFVGRVARWENGVWHEGDHPACWSRDIFRRVGGYAPELMWGRADVDFMVTLVEANANGIYVPAVLYEYRQHRYHCRVSSSYSGRIAKIHDIIVERHPMIFSDRRWRRKFLSRGYQEHAMQLYATGDRENAAKAARIACMYGGGWKIWPLQHRGRVTRQLVDMALLLRRWCGRARCLIGESLRR